jgi:hypothetical protein
MVQCQVPPVVGKRGPPSAVLYQPQSSLHDNTILGSCAPPSLCLETDVSPKIRKNPAGRGENVDEPVSAFERRGFFGSRPAHRCGEKRGNIQAALDQPQIKSVIGEVFKVAAVSFKPNRPRSIESV